MLVENTKIEMSPSDEHGGEISPNVWQQVPFKQEEAGMVAEPQSLPEETSVYVIVYEVGGLSMLLCTASS